MKRVLLGHVVKGTYFLGAGLDSNTNSGTDRVLPTLDGGTNKIMISGRSIISSFISSKIWLIITMNLFLVFEDIRVDGIPVVTSVDNIMAENGVIHGMSHVLMPR